MLSTITLKNMEKKLKSPKVSSWGEKTPSVIIFM